MGSRLTLDRAPYDRERDPQTLSRAFREPGAQGPTQRTAGAEGRPEHSLHLGRNAAASALLPGLERSSRAPAREQPEMPAHRRHRRGGEDRPARHLLRDARQLHPDRRLFQGDRHPSRVGAGDGGFQDACRPAAGDDPPVRRPGVRDLDHQDVSTRRPRHPAR